jgi:hypothetical protein
MSSPIGLAAVVANVAVLLVPAAAIASPRVSQLARLQIATVAFACAWPIAAAFDALRAPRGAILMGGAVIVESVVIVVATLHRWARPRDPDETQSEGRGDEGGSGPRRHRPDGPQPEGSASDPSWWPEFERMLALYVAERERESMAR